VEERESEYKQGNELWTTQHPLQWLVGVLLPGVKWLMLEASTHLHLVLRLRIYEDTSPLP